MGMGLVLGGGGVVGVAWEVGVLAGLADALAWDPASADVIVGTSAGSVIGTQLRQGRTITELVDEQREGGLRVARGTAGDADPDATLEVFTRWASADLMDAPTAREVGQLAVALPLTDEATMLDSFRAVLPSESWPAADLRITGVSVTTGERVAWSSSDGVELVRAVTASCAVPGMFPAITVGEDRYLDGGLWSGSNADLLVGDALPAALFVGPMGVGATGLGRLSARMLDHERTALATAGTSLSIVEPGDRFTAAAMQLMDPSRRLEALEIGLAEGAEAANRLHDLVP